jgi:hypothetical protein
MLFPKYVLEDLSVGSDSIIGKGNIEEFFNHISMHKDVKDRSLAELAPSYEVVATYLVHMLEARFGNLNPFMQQMFLKLHDIEDSEKKDFILETLHREFREVSSPAGYSGSIAHRPTSRSASPPSPIPGAMARPSVPTPRSSRVSK